MKLPKQIWMPLSILLTCLAAGPVYAACTNPTGSERDLIYNGDYRTYQFCDGTNWVAAGGTTAPQHTHVGYFVLSKTTWNGNLGTMPVADAKCLTDLTTNTGWKGYATANANGQLVSGKVHAFLAYDASSWAPALLPNATYYFANANDATAGGAAFTTDANGDGPGNATAWNGLTYFNGDFTYWSGRDDWSATLWYDEEYGADCYTATGWDNATAGATGSAGRSTLTDFGRWENGQTPACNTLQHLICYVSP